MEGSEYVASAFLFHKWKHNSSSHETLSPKNRASLKYLPRVTIHIPKQDPEIPQSKRQGSDCLPVHTQKNYLPDISQKPGVRSQVPYWEGSGASPSISIAFQTEKSMCPTAMESNQSLFPQVLQEGLKEAQINIFRKQSKFVLLNPRNANKCN